MELRIVTIMEQSPDKGIQAPKQEDLQNTQEVKHSVQGIQYLRQPLNFVLIGSSLSTEQGSPKQKLATAPLALNTSTSLALYPISKDYQLVHGYSYRDRKLPLWTVIWIARADSWWVLNPDHKVEAVLIRRENTQSNLNERREIHGNKGFKYSWSCSAKLQPKKLERYGKFSFAFRACGCSNGIMFVVSGQLSNDLFC